MTLGRFRNPAESSSELDAPIGDGKPSLGCPAVNDLRARQADGFGRQERSPYYTLDDDLPSKIREVIVSSPFVGEERSLH